MTLMPQDFNFFNIFRHFILSVPFEILSRNPNNDGSHCFNKEVQWILDKIFSGKRTV